MQVLHRANAIWTADVQCRHCGSVLRIHEGDLKVYAVGYNGPYNWISDEESRIIQECRDLQMYIVCPRCHEHNNVSRLVPNNTKRIKYAAFINELEKNG